MKTVDSTSCWLALLYIIVSLFGLYPPITELPIGGSFDLHIRQQLVNSGNQHFQLEEPIRYNRFEWGRRFVPNASLSLVPSLSPSSNLSENPNGDPVLSLDPSFNLWDSSSSTQLLKTSPVTTTTRTAMATATATKTMMMTTTTTTTTTTQCACRTSA